MVEDSYAGYYGHYGCIAEGIDCCIELKSWCWNLLIGRTAPLCSKSRVHYPLSNAHSDLDTQKCAAWPNLSSKYSFCLSLNYPPKTARAIY